jgi:hypothetical protein
MDRYRLERTPSLARKVSRQRAHRRLLRFINGKDELPRRRSDTVTVKVLVDNGAGKLRPGLFARVSFVTGGEAKGQASGQPAAPASAGSSAAAAPSPTEEPKQ